MMKIDFDFDIKIAFLIMQKLSSNQVIHTSNGPPDCGLENAKLLLNRFLSSDMAAAESAESFPLSRPGQCRLDFNWAN